MLRFIRRRQSPDSAQPNGLSANNTPSDPTNLPAEGSRIQSDSPTADNTAPIGGQSSDKVSDSPAQSDQDKPSLFSKLAKKMGMGGNSFGDSLGQLLLGKKEIDDELLEDIETQLLLADVGVETTNQIIAGLTAAIERDALTDASTLFKYLKLELKKVLGDNAKDFVIDANRAPYVILVVGVNGAGKTTTIGKLAKRLQKEKFDVMLAAGDTFRAAACEQLQVWGDRNQIPVVAQHTGADSASVIYDALQSGKARNADVLIADTAGRLHNKDNLMEELKKVVRVMKKIDASAPHEILLVLDASTGQNAITQAEKFKQAVGVTGIAVTKLDGTAKGGVVFAIREQLGLPIRFIGVGEGIDDLRPFDVDEFVEAIFAGN